MRNFNRFVMAPGLALAIAAGTAACGEAAPSVPAKITAAPASPQDCKIMPGVELDGEAQRDLVDNGRSESLRQLGAIVVGKKMKVSGVRLLVPDEDLKATQTPNTSQEIKATAIARSAIDLMDLPAQPEPFHVDGSPALPAGSMEFDLIINAKCTVQSVPTQQTA